MPLLVALPAQIRQSDLAMLGNLHRRVGDESPTTSRSGTVTASDASADSAAGAFTSLGDGSGRQAWGRAIYNDLNIAQGGSAAARSSGHVSGLQAGTDLLATNGWRAGIYVGFLDGSASVGGNAHGLVADVGGNDLRARYLGGYATWMNAGGTYIDTVLQGGSYRNEVRPFSSPRASAEASSLSASVEVGKPYALSDDWSVEPQAQLIYQKSHSHDVTLGDFTQGTTRVTQEAEGAWIGRLGVRLKGDMVTRAGRLQPYLRANVYRSSSGTDTTTFTTPAAITPITSATGYTSTELAGGFTLSLTPATSVYGELGRLFSNSGEVKVKSSVQGSVGLRVSF